MSWPAMPWSMARPIAAGMSAWLTIQTMPKHHARDDGADLHPGQPQQVCERATVVRHARIGDG